MKRKLALILFATALTSGCAKQSTTSYPPCQAGPDEKCPSDIFLADWDRLSALQAKYKPPTEVQDQMNGIVASLNDQAKPYQEITMGINKFNWDEKKRRFVKNPAFPVTAPLAAK